MKNSIAQSKPYYLSIPLYKQRGLDSIEKAIEIYRTCRKMNKKITKTIDTLIAVSALENNLELFHLDKEFDMMAECTPLKIYRWKS